MSSLPEVGKLSYLDRLDGMGTDWARDEREEVASHNRAAWEALKRGYDVRRLADVPGFLDALQTEWLMGYSLTDIGAIYGVSRERVRQWFRDNGLHHDSGGASYRLWDDDLDCFMPVSREEYRERAREHAERRHCERVEERKDVIAGAIRDAAGRVRGRPTLVDVAQELGIPSSGTGHVAHLAGMWDQRVQAGDLSYADACDAMYERAGVPRPRANDWLPDRPARFTPAEARAIRDEYEHGDVSQAELAERHGCATATMTKVLHRRHPYDGVES